MRNAADGYHISYKKKEKWKKTRSRAQFNSEFSTFQVLQYLRLCLNGFLFLSIFVKPVLGEGERWDGVLVTESNFLALQAFKQELIDPKGFLKSWNDSGYGACSGGWAGIKCAKGQVIVIQLPYKGLKGHITEKIGQLQGLRKLSLHDNEIQGSIPSELGILSNLRGLQLFNNKFTGSIPPSLGFCPLLQSLDLSNNFLTGKIPDSLGNSTKLYWLNLSYNFFSGPIPSSLIGSASLSFLFLQHNNLSGSLPSFWGGTLKNSDFFRLQNLILDHNFFSGSIPSFRNLIELEQISLSQNQFTGAIPNDIGRLSRLKILDFSNNALTGSLPVTLSNLSSLSLLNVEDNKLDNQIPEALGRLRNLSVLKLSRNQFSGRIPASIGNISKLNELNLSQNNLSGEIPVSFDNLGSLNSFNVSYNNLSGSVPTILAQKFNSSSFVGNIQLCEYSPSTPCPSQPPSKGFSASPPEALKHHRYHKKLGTKEILLIAVGILLIVLAILCCILLFCLIGKRDESREGGQAARRAATAARVEKGVPPTNGGEVEAGGEAGGKLVHFDGPMTFTADDLLCATAEIMGKSTYGTVYKATLEDGGQVAVKRLREKITKGQREFESEVSVLGKIRHPNVLAMRACYLGPKAEMLLIFDYMPRGSLAAFLHATGPQATAIDWPTRMKIGQGMARGLFYLHTHTNIIHGNLASNNVLLDENTNPKIADYGLSRLMTVAANSSVVAAAAALGYRAPELSKAKKANTKTDVYNLGVILLELLTRKSPSEPINGLGLPQWVVSIVKEEWTNEVFDAQLIRDEFINGAELLLTLKVALHCVDPSPSARPEVQQVLQQLEGIRLERSVSSGAD